MQKTPWYTKLSLPSHSGNRSVTCFPPPSFLHAMKTQLRDHCHMWYPLCDLFTDTLLNQRCTPKSTLKSRLMSLLVRRGVVQSCWDIHVTKLRAESLQPSAWPSKTAGVKRMPFWRHRLAVLGSVAARSNAAACWSVPRKHCPEVTQICKTLSWTVSHPCAKSGLGASPDTCYRANPLPTSPCTTEPSRLHPLNFSF